VVSALDVRAVLRRWLYDRWGARVVVPVGGAVLGGALLLTGHVAEMRQYYAAFGVLGAAGVACVQAPR